jgi:hypothetical protein
MGTTITMSVKTANLVRKLAADLTSENNGQRVSLDRTIALSVMSYRQLHNMNNDVTDQQTATITE